ncbi:DUF2316 family protein [Lentilactobacillus parafarraginis]|jgi:hypothetical protein|uniref:DUF2316 domain-containing protein n=2 Tax=Lentilactobacillus parafarraginis TaxID=390842 RepID=A0A0R1YMH0_9LACO|nr:DUF2316 family protein [Lentilactobacillus parafarraginis]KRM43077.1 hypothetical protein FD47_GL001672 [Lentilactobacillus parafarraginis DSM 18390 = JCM 14109]TLQ19038.1 DUF2316 family protein [Lentilactobacillus parafarraginis]
MSLNAEQTDTTRHELQENFELSGVSLAEAAADLKTSAKHLSQVLSLNPTRIEEPWVLKNYLDAKIQAAGKQPVAYTALVGDPKDYWFLSDQFIKAGRLLQK